MKICVIGAGALGTFYSTMMAAAGCDVTLVCRPKDAPLISKGTEVTGGLSATARPTVSTQPIAADLVFVAVKSYDVASAVRGIPLNPETLIVIIHNGLGSDEVAARELGTSRVAVGVAYCGVTFLGPGRVKVAGYTETVLGSVDLQTEARLGMAVLALESAGLKVRIAGDIRAAQWEKMYANVGINAITAITGLTNGMLLEVPELKALVAATVTEAGEVSKAIGISTGIDPTEQTYKVIRDTYHNRSSMLQDVLKGKKTEIDVLNGKVSELGRMRDVPTPVNDTITALVKGIERRNGP